METAAETTAIAVALQEELGSSGEDNVPSEAELRQAFEKVAQDRANR